MILCFLASLSYARLRAQTRPVAVAPQRAAAASQPPYDRLELLASLRAFESKPYLVDKIRDRGVDFTPDGTFLEGVDSRLNTPDILDAIAESRRSGVPESQERHKAYLILVDVILQRLTPSVREQYEAAVALAPDSAALHMAYGGALLLVADFPAAETQERLSLQLWPGDADAHVALLLAFAGQGRDDEAILEAREALRIYPDHKGALVELGMELTRDRQFKEAVPVLREAIARAPEVVLLHKHLGLSLFNTGDIEGAIAEEVLYLRTYPNDAEGHYDLGVAFRAQGHADDALAQFREAARLAPSNPVFSALADPSAAETGLETTDVPHPDDGSIDDDIYTNKFFQFSFRFPEEWTVMGADAQRNAAILGGEMLAGSDQTLLDITKAGAAHGYPLLFVMEGKSGGQAYSTRSIQVSAIDVRNNPDLISAEDFMKKMAKMFEKLQSPLRVVGPPIEMPLGGKVMWRMDLEMPVNNGVNHVAEIVTIEKGYMLFFTLLSPDEDGLNGLLQDMNSLRFFQSSD